MVDKETTKKNSRISECAPVILVAVISCTIYSSMLSIVILEGTIPQLLPHIMLFVIMASIANVALNYKTIDKTVAVLVIIYLFFRFVSYRINGLSIHYGEGFMIEAFYLIGISSSLFGSEKSKKTVIYSFILFDAVVLIINYYNLLFRKEYIDGLWIISRETHPIWVITYETSLFTNANHAGLMAGAAIVICLAIMANHKHSKAVTIALLCLIVANLYIVCISTCRSAQTGVAAVIVLAIFVMLNRTHDSIRKIVAVSLIISVLSMCSVYILVYWGDNETRLIDNNVEYKINEASSARYMLWKTFILSQKGHILLGQGDNKTAIKRRIEYISSIDPVKVEEKYRYSMSLNLGQHNGFLCMINETGWIGYILFMLILLRKAWHLRGRFRGHNWEYMLVIYILWINLFESKLITVTFFTGYMLMVLLATDMNEGDEKNRYYRARQPGKHYSIEKH